MYARVVKHTLIVKMGTGAKQEVGHTSPFPQEDKQAKGTGSLASVPMTLTMSQTDQAGAFKTALRSTRMLAFIEINQESFLSARLILFRRSRRGSRRRFSMGENKLQFKLLGA